MSLRLTVSVHEKPSFLATWLRPEVTLWVSLGLSHAIQFEREVTEGKFPSLDEAIAHEFATLPENTQKFVYIDGDQELMRKSHKNIPAKILEFRRSELKRYNVYPTRTDFVFDGASFSFFQSSAS